MSTDYAHSEPLQAAAETGWAGLALWLLGAGAALRALLRQADEDPVREAAASAAAAMTAQLAIDNMLQIPALAALWLCALALAALPGGAKERAWPATAILAGTVLALGSWVPKTLAANSPSRAATIFPAEPGPREDLAYAAMAAGRAGDSEAHWTAAQELSPFNAIYPWRLAQLAGAADLWVECEELAADATALEPGFLNARLLRADALLRLGRRPDARAELAEVARIRAARKDVPPDSGYDRTVREFDADAHERLAALASFSGGTDDATR